MANIMKLAVLKFVVLFTIITFLWAGLLINVIQLLNYVILRRLNFALFAKINYYLMYSSWSQIVALFDWFFGAKMNVYHKDIAQEDDIFDDHSVFLANHNYELDWIGAWLVTEKFGHLANCKAMLKSDLKYIPVVGWTWTLSDQILLDRNWERDKNKFGVAINNLLKYKPFVMTFFCEGARCTANKLEACKQFALERKLEAPKHHLIPRTKGWCAFTKLLREKTKSLYDENKESVKVWIYTAQVAYDEREALSIADILNKGTAPSGHIYFERYDFNEVPKDDEGAAKWLLDIYLQKDNLHDYFIKHHEFPGHKDKRFLSYKPRLSSFLNWLIWFSYTFASMAYIVGRCYAAYGAFYVSLVVFGCFGMSYAYLTYIIFETDIEDKSKKPSVRNNKAPKNGTNKNHQKINGSTVVSNGHKKCD